MITTTHQNRVPELSGFSKLLANTHRVSELSGLSKMLSSIHLRYNNNSRLAQQFLCLVMLSSFSSVLGHDSDLQPTPAFSDDMIYDNEMGCARVVRRHLLTDDCIENEPINDTHRRLKRAQVSHAILPFQSSLPEGPEKRLHELLQSVQTTGTPTVQNLSLLPAVNAIAHMASDHDRKLKMYEEVLANLPAKYNSRPTKADAVAPRLHGKHITYTDDIKTLLQMREKCFAVACQPPVYDPKTRKVHEELMSKLAAKVLSLCYNKLTVIPKWSGLIGGMTWAKGYFSDSQNATKTMSKIKNFVREYHINPKDIPQAKHGVFTITADTRPDGRMKEDALKQLTPDQNSTMSFDTDAKYYLDATINVENTSKFFRNGKYADPYNKAPAFLRPHISRNADGSVREWYFKGHTKSMTADSLGALTSLAGFAFCQDTANRKMFSEVYDVNTGHCSDANCELKCRSVGKCSCGKNWTYPKCYKCDGTGNKDKDRKLTGKCKKGNEKHYTEQDCYDAYCEWETNPKPCADQTKRCEDCSGTGKSDYSLWLKTGWCMGKRDCEWTVRLVRNDAGEAEIQLWYKEEEYLVYKKVDKKIDVGNGIYIDTEAKYTLQNTNNTRAKVSALKMIPEFLRCHFGQTEKCKNGIEWHTTKKLCTMKNNECEWVPENWYFTGDYNGECGTCGSKARDYETGKCAHCGEARKASREYFEINTTKVFETGGLDSKVSRVERWISLETGGLDSWQSWDVTFVQDTEGPYIQLTRKFDEETVTLNYKKIGEDEVDLERRCTEFKTFNDFFSRGIAVGRRPNISSDGKSLIKADSKGWAPLISGADCRAMAFPTVDTATKFWVKEKEWDLEKFLGVDNAIRGGNCPTCKGTGCSHKDASPVYCKKWRLFGGGHGCITCPACQNNSKVHTNRLLAPNGKQTKPSMVIFRLAPQDYHRFHYAVSGTVVDHYKIKGVLYSVNPTAINQDKFNVFQENQRYVTVIETANGKRVIAIPVGAAMVGSIVFEEDDGTSTVKKGTKIKAGDLHGKMRFGGSTVVYLFEEGMVKYDEDLITRCTQDWTEKVPCPSPTCTFNTMW